MSKEIIDKQKSNLEVAENVELHGLFVSYEDDQLNELIKATLKQKTRVKFNCLDTFSDYLAFGSSSGAIYLYKLDIPYHSSCELISMWPCDQGSIEVIKFLPEPVNSGDPLIVIGTTKGSIVVFKFSITNERALIRNEIYKDKLSTNEECGVKMLEGNNPFSKLYICDKANRLYVLDIETIYSKNTFRALCIDQKPSLLYVVEDSNINQISVNGSHLLISTNETTRFFDDQSPESKIIGKQQRKKGFYGACFFPDLESTTSIFVARPDFRLWQVNYNDELNVMFTHQFKSLIKTFKYPNEINLHNKPIDENEIDNPSTVMNDFLISKNITRDRVVSKNFQKIIPIFSKTLGSLLLSYTQNDILVINPISAQLIVCYSQEIPIIQVCFNEREIFIWSLDTIGGRRHYELKRLVLLSPAQFVIELHRLNRFLTLIEFVEYFSELFKNRMALPIYGSNIIKIDGGLLRNILINAWNVYMTNNVNDEYIDERHMEFRGMIETILEEGSQLKQSLENLTDSRFFIPISNENIDRLCSEPYASLVSLQVCLKDLHLNNVIHFTKDALNRHKSVINLSQSIQKLKRSNLNLTTKSSLDLVTSQTNEKNNVSEWRKPSDKVIVERQRPKRITKLQVDTQQPAIAILHSNCSTDGLNSISENRAFFESKLSLKGERNQVGLSTGAELTGEAAEEEEERPSDIQALEAEFDESSFRCKSCQWPKARAHLKNLNSTQKIQLKWIETNLMGNLEENINQIKNLSFKHGLWRVFLKCLTFSNELDDYITCCMMLDDIRLLDDRFVITRRGEDKIIDKFLIHLSEKLVLTKDGKEVKCLKCKNEFEITNDNGQGNSSIHLRHHQEDELSFTLVNLFENFMLRPNADMKKIIKCLVNHTELLNVSKIPTTFYLKVIAFATLIANQSPLSRTRLNQLRGSSASSLL